MIVKRLRQTGAVLIWASTTPIPPGIARRKPEDAVRYNAVAGKIMEGSGVAVNDLYASALPHLAQWLLPGNVHNSPEGAAGLGRRVAAAMETALAEPKRAMGSTRNGADGKLHQI